MYAYDLTEPYEHRSKSTDTQYFSSTQHWSQEEDSTQFWQLQEHTDQEISSAEHQSSQGYGCSVSDHKERLKELREGREQPHRDKLHKSSARKGWGLFIPFAWLASGISPRHQEIPTALFIFHYSRTRKARVKQRGEQFINSAWSKMRLLIFKRKGKKEGEKSHTTSQKARFTSPVFMFQ